MKICSKNKIAFKINEPLRGTDFQKACEEITGLFFYLGKSHYVDRPQIKQANYYYIVSFAITIRVQKADK